MNWHEPFARVFRKYKRVNYSPDKDTIFDYLEAIHSLNDRMNKNGLGNFYSSNEFKALKCLRNFFHHHEELRDRFVILNLSSVEVSHDLIYMIGVDARTVEAALNEEKEIYRDDVRKSIDHSFHFYGSNVNINPAIFNFTVQIFEKFQKIGIEINDPDLQEFAENYFEEESEGRSHFVDGRISTHAANTETVREILEQALTQKP